MSYCRGGQCQYPGGCFEKARYPIYHTIDGKKEWIWVCGFHEKAIGDENLRRLGGRYRSGKRLRRFSRLEGTPIVEGILWGKKRR